MSALWRRDTGQALVEMSIMMPLLMVVLVGIFEFGRAWQVKQVVTNAAREGARSAVLPDVGADSVTKVINQYLTSANVDLDDTVITLSLESSAGSSDQVTVTYDYDFALMSRVVTLISGGQLDGSITLASTAIMRNE